MKTISVLLCDDHAFVREGLRLLLEDAEDIEVVGEADNGRQAVEATKRLLPDVVILDLSMPLLNGVEAARRIAKEVPSAKVLILSAYADVLHLQQAVEAGAAGYLTKGASSNDLLPAIRDIARGKTAFRPSVVRCLMKQWQEELLNGCPVTTSATTLSSRQTEILQLIAEGYANKQIAGLLAVGTKTVEKHRQDIMHKLNIHKTATLTRYAVSMGVVECDRVLHLPGDDIAANPRLGRGRSRRPAGRRHGERQEAEDARQSPIGVMDDRWLGFAHKHNEKQTNQTYAYETQQTP